VVEVVGVVVFPTVLASFLDASLADPDTFPGVVALSDFAFRSPCLSFVVVPATGSVSAGGGFGGFISVCYYLIILPLWGLTGESRLEGE
jgi:hypothetical protein